MVARNFVEKLKIGLLNTLYFIRYNVFLLLLTGFFAYRTFFVGNLNYALLILLIALLLIIVCQVLYKYVNNINVRVIYRVLILTSGMLLITSLCIQAMRFVDVFVPTLTEPTLAKILVRIGIVTVTLYVFGLFFTFVYYLYINDMLSLIWNGSLKRKLNPNSLKNLRSNWRKERFASIILVNLFIWGGFASITSLLIGFIAWLLR